MKLISAQVAFLYAKQHYPLFPADWYASKYITWNDVFINEKKEYGCPVFGIFEQVVKTAIEFDKAEEYTGYEFIPHCFVRTKGHKEAIKKQGYKPAEHSSHEDAMAEDFHAIDKKTKKVIPHAKVRAKLLEGVKSGKLHIRIEANTPDRVHMDVGNKYLKNYKWGMFNP